MASVDPEDLKLPQAPIVKLMKQGAGEGVNFSNEAKVSVARAAAVFCLHVADHASDISNKAKRKTVTANDIIEAM
uniref:Transcription factor CBF/NF-Y/archaeal histone domain-containing protein n=1 Tax=Panagrolaimus sp. JU765 TaxID=591449 RepID=A0AC34QUW5_9BILA